jgi:broad specificity phosphatase PhoE
VKLALVRHAITAWNLEKRVQGRIDQPLDDIGRRQFQSLAIPPRYLDFRWYCSPLGRATESAQLLDLADVTLETALLEMHWGDWEGEILRPLRKRLGDEMRDNESRGLDFRPPGGESPRDVQTRLQPWLQDIAATGQDTAAVVHTGIIRCIYALASGWDMRGECPVDFSWGSLHQFELSADGVLKNTYESIPLEKT